SIPSGSEQAMSEIGMPVLSPADPSEFASMGIHGVEISRACGLWVGMKLATNVVDGATTVEHTGPVPELETPTGTDAWYQHHVDASFQQPILTRLEASMHERQEIAIAYVRQTSINDIIGDQTARVGLVCAGSKYLEVVEALQQLGFASPFQNSGLR